MIHSLEYTRI